MNFVELSLRDDDAGRDQLSPDYFRGGIANSGEENEA